MPSKTGHSGSMTQHPLTCFWGQQETHYDMEKTVQVKTDSDAVKIAVITTQNKIVTGDEKKSDKPSDTTNLQMDADIEVDAQSEAQVDTEISASALA